MPTPNSSVQRTARDIKRLQQGVFHANTQPRLRYSSIDGGNVELRDMAGNTLGYVGEQFDGSVGMVATSPTPPAQPSLPLVTAIQGGLTVYWDGTWADGSVTRLDFARVTFHAVTNVDDFDPTSAAQIVGHITTATGGEINVSLPPVEHFVFAVAWSTSGVYSLESDPAFGTPLSLLDAEEWQAHETALNDLNNTTLPALEIALNEKTQTVFEPTQPSWVGPDDRVIWYDTANDNAGSYWDGSTWAPYALGADAIASDAIATRHLAADAVTANKIAAAAVTATKIEAGAVTAEKVAVSVLESGFVLSGRIQVGEQTWTPSEGLVIPQPGGGRIHLPADGVTPARFDGHINAKSATIEGNLNIMGATNKVNGSVTLSAGVTEPTVAPSAWGGWSSVYSDVLDSSTASWRMYAGRSTHHSQSDRFTVAMNYGGLTLRTYNSTTGGWAGDIDLTGQAWKNNFFAYGIAYAGGHYYIIGHDTSRYSDVYIYKITSAGAKVAELLAATAYDMQGRTPAVATDGTRVYMAFPNRYNSEIVRINHWTVDLNPASGISNDTGLSIGVNFTGAHLTSADAGAAHIWLVAEDARRVYAIQLSSFAQDPSLSFQVAGNRLGRGIWYDPIGGRFKGIDREGYLTTYSSWKTDQSLTISNTWYDSDGTVRETREGPVANFTLPARTYLNIETSVPPDSGNTDPLQVDKANRTGVYVGVGGGARRLQGYLGVDGSGNSIRQMSTEAVSTTSATAPAANTFIGGQTSTGRIISGATTAGQPSLEISGDGSIKAESLTLRGQVLPRTQAGQVSGSFSGAAAVDVSVTFPTAFAAVPTIVATPVDGGNAYYGINVKSASTTGATLRLTTFNGAGVPWGVYVNWIAVGT